MFLGFVLFVGIGALSRQNERPYSASIFYLALGQQRRPVARCSDRSP